ncbi:MAG: hypothetical protein RI965_960 [Bacteroidota bacterium]|jgi:2-polyprenyl-3-methyl-5-hydroxy-6-metoxy-1,4-benzoquinol methylase
MNCPVCNHDAAFAYLQVRDYTVSNKLFELVMCQSCGFLYTNNPPDKNQIGAYYQSDAYISHTDSKKGIFNNVYQSVRNFSIRQKLNLVKKYSQRSNGNILDYGCGTGSFLHFMKLNGWHVTGIEPDASAQKKASELISQQVFNPDHLKSLESNHFDVVTLWHVLEHVHDLQSTVADLKRILKKNSMLIIAVPNHLSWDAKHYKEHWAAYDVPRHLYHFNPDSMHQLLLRHGFSRKALKPMWFDAFYVSLLSEKYRHGKMRVISALVTGFISNMKAFIKPGTCSSQIFIYQSSDH